MPLMSRIGPDNNKFSIIMKKKNCILCVKNCLLKTMENVTVGILQSKNVKLFLVKHTSIFGVGYYNRKNKIFLFINVLSLISSLKNSEVKQPVKTCSKSEK